MLFDDYSIASYPRCIFRPGDLLPAQWSVIELNCHVTKVFYRFSWSLRHMLLVGHAWGLLLYLVRGFPLADVDLLWHHFQTTYIFVQYNYVFVLKGVLSGVEVGINGRVVDSWCAGYHPISYLPGTVTIQWPHEEFCCVHVFMYSLFGFTLLLTSFALETINGIALFIAGWFALWMMYQFLPFAVRYFTACKDTGRFCAL